MVLAGSHGYVSVGVPRMRPVVRTKKKANPGTKGTIASNPDVSANTSKRDDSHRDESETEEEEEEVVLVCLTPPPILEVCIHALFLYLPSKIITILLHSYVCS